MKVKTITYYNDGKIDYEIIMYQNNGQEIIWGNKNEINLHLLLQEAWKAGRNKEEFILGCEGRGDLPEGRDTGLCFDFGKYKEKEITDNKLKNNKIPYEDLLKNLEKLANEYGETIMLTTETYCNFTTVLEILSNIWTSLDPKSKEHFAEFICPQK